MTQDDLDTLAKNKDPLVKLLLEEYLQYTTDPTKMFYLECSEMIKTFATEMKIVREVDKDDPAQMEEALKKIKMLGSDKKDGLFERVLALMDKAPKIIEGLRSLQPGNEQKAPSGKTKKEDNIPS